MKVKKLISLIVIFCFLNFAVIPVFAATTKDKDREKAVLAVVGIVAFVGIIYMLNNMGAFGLSEEEQESNILDKLPLDIKFGLEYSNTDIYNNRFSNDLSNQSMDKFLTPTLMMNIGW